MPETYGGAGGSTMDYALAMEEVSWGDASHSVVVSVQNSLVCDPILRFGNETQRAAYLPALASGLVRSEIGSRQGLHGVADDGSDLATRVCVDRFGHLVPGQLHASLQLFLASSL